MELRPTNPTTHFTSLFGISTASNALLPSTPSTGLAPSQQVRTHPHLHKLRLLLFPQLSESTQGCGPETWESSLTPLSHSSFPSHLLTQSCLWTVAMSLKTFNFSVSSATTLESLSLRNYGNGLSIGPPHLFFSFLIHSPHASRVIFYLFIFSFFKKISLNQ